MRQGRSTAFLILGFCACLAAIIPIQASGAEWFVAANGNDSSPGTQESPLRTIQHAAELAQPGDTVTVHAGVYRERINPPRGGTSDTKRIVYQAAPGEKVEIKGSEVVGNWERVQNDTWKTTLPNSFFGSFNPYRDLIHGDWFFPNHREHHTGAVYLNGKWLVEACTLDDVLRPFGEVLPAFVQQSRDVLLNVAWLRIGERTDDSERIAATDYAAKNGTRNAECSEGGQCVGWIRHGHWLRYENVDFGKRTDQVEIRAASATRGGIVEFRLDGPDGELLGTCAVPNTGDWQLWSSFYAKVRPLSGRKTLCLAFRAAEPLTSNPGLWFAQVDNEKTTLWAQFKDVDPNKQLVEINVRRTVFYPDKPGRNFLTVRGFTMCHAATPWAPPTAEQIGLVGTHWSKGWIIEDNVISHSACSGIALGKHGDEFDNTSADSAEGYIETIQRAHAFSIPWTKENIGHHIVRNNTISHCEQTGIVGSLGAVFSTITGNTIHDIHVRRLFGGCEMAGIKIHAAIDVEISRNRIYRTCLGLWLDWMAQGTRVTQNLFYDNLADLFTEVNHGPILIDNNVFLSASNGSSNSQGVVYAHNLFSGALVQMPHDARKTPYLRPHSTEIAGFPDNPPGDSQFFNNVFVGRGTMSTFDRATLPISAEGNVFFKGTKACKFEQKPLFNSADVPVGLLANESGVSLTLPLPAGWVGAARRQTVTTALLGTAQVSHMAYENPDGSPLRVDRDYHGKPIDTANPVPGPFADPAGGKIVLAPTTAK